MGTKYLYLHIPAYTLYTYLIFCAANIRRIRGIVFVVPVSSVPRRQYPYMGRSGQFHMISLSNIEIRMYYPVLEILYACPPSKEFQWLCPHRSNP